MRAKKAKQRVQFGAAQQIKIGNDTYNLNNQRDCESLQGSLIQKINEHLLEVAAATDSESKSRSELYRVQTEKLLKVIMEAMERHNIGPISAMCALHAAQLHVLMSLLEELIRCGKAELIVMN